MDISVCVVQVQDFTVFLLQKPLVELNLFLQTPNVTLEFPKSGFITALLDGLVESKISTTLMEPNPPDAPSDGADAQLSSSQVYSPVLHRCDATQR